MPKLILAATAVPIRIELGQRPLALRLFEQLYTGPMTGQAHTRPKADQHRPFAAA
jgi:hypothetical protein